MAMFTTTIMMLGVFLSMVSGLVWYVGAGDFYDQLAWLPQSNLLISNPEFALVIGALLIVTSFICQPSRLQ
jgi:hypothetical protein